MSNENEKIPVQTEDSRGVPLDRLVSVRMYDVEWYAYPDGARISSRGVEPVKAVSKEQAEALLKARYPSILHARAR